MQSFLEEYLECLRVVLLVVELDHCILVSELLQCLGIELVNLLTGARLCESCLVNSLGLGLLGLTDWSDSDLHSRAERPPVVKCTSLDPALVQLFLAQLKISALLGNYHITRSELVDVLVERVWGWVDLLSHGSNVRSEDIVFHRDVSVNVFTGDLTVAHVTQHWIADVL